MDLKAFENSIPDVGDTKDQLITKLRACLLALQTHVSSSEAVTGQFKQMRDHLDKNTNDLHDKLHAIAATLDEWAK